MTLSFSSFLDLPSSFFPILPTSLSFSQHSARCTRLRNFTLQPLPLPPKQRTFNSRKDDEARQEKLHPQAHSLSHEKTQRHHQSCDLSPNAGIPGCHGDAFVVYGRGGGEGKSSEDSDWETGRGKKILHVRTGMMSSQYQVPVYTCPQFSRLGIQVSLAIYIYVCLSGLWFGGLLHLSFLCDFLKLVCYAHIFSCKTSSAYMYIFSCICDPLWEKVPFRANIDF